jgi:asparaginyl-tRNA synthetase
LAKHFFISSQFFHLNGYIYEIIYAVYGGSRREERYDELEQKINEFGLDPKPYWWYLELRKYGSVPHSGFGAGFERLIRLVTGLDIIRDVIPFPRIPGSAAF